MSAISHPIRCIRVAHAATAIGLLGVASWGLLSVNPLAPVNGTSFSFLRTVDDFLIHLSVYSIVAFAVMSLFRDASRLIQHWCGGAIIAHAVSTELLQALIPQRNCDPVDLVANLIGIMLGIKLVSVMPRSETNMDTGVIHDGLQSGA